MKEQTKGRKFMQTLGIDTWRKLRKVAQERDISIQELIRVEIVPHWFESKNED